MLGTEIEQVLLLGDGHLWISMDDEPGADSIAGFVLDWRELPESGRKQASVFENSIVCLLVSHFVVILAILLMPRCRGWPVVLSGYF